MMAAALAEPAPSPQGRLGRPRAGELDILIGKRVRERRLALGFTMQELAAALGVPHQQLHKYETGANRLSAGRLFLLAGALRVEVAHFFGETGADEPAAPVAQRRMLLELARNFARIPDRHQREAITRLARTLADLGEGGDGGPAAESGAARRAPEQGERGGRRPSAAAGGRPGSSLRLSHSAIVTTSRGRHGT